MPYICLTSQLREELNKVKTKRKKKYNNNEKNMSLQIK